MDWLFWLFPIAVAIFVVYLIYKKAAKDKLRKEPLLTVYSDVRETTNQGTTVLSKSGVSQDIKDIIDDSLTDVFADARALGYTEKLNYSDYFIYVLHNCIPSPETGTPSFKLRADEYDGTEFDQDPRKGIGYVLASEYVLMEGINPSTSYVICNDLQNAYNAVRYGAEHIILFNNNYSEYERTRFHGTGIYHPIIPKRQ